MKNTTITKAELAKELNTKQLSLTTMKNLVKTFETELEELKKQPNNKDNISVLTKSIAILKKRIHAREYKPNMTPAQKEKFKERRRTTTQKYRAKIKAAKLDQQLNTVNDINLPST